MPSIIEDPERNIIPLWKSFSKTTTSGELSNSRKPNLSAKPSVPSADLLKLVHDWERERKPAYAADLVCAAMVSNHYDLAKDAATFLLDQRDETLNAVIPIAKTVLGIVNAPAEEGFSQLDTAGIRIKIKTLKKRLNNNPRDSFVWIDLAREWETLGQSEQADRAILIAKRMIPENRFLLRSMARMLIHRSQKGKAQRILAESSRIRFDPWLLAAEIAVSTSMGKASTLTKFAREMIESGKFSEFHLSELRSALGTLEAINGKYGKARELLMGSLVQPTDNSTAQAAWVNRSQKLDLGDFFQHPENVSKSPETSAWNNFKNGQWRQGLDHSFKWLSDQPFSKRPITLGSFIAISALNDNLSAKKILEYGLRSNPDDWLILNNYTVCLARLGEVNAARSAFNKINPSALEARSRITWTATSGLLSFREGNIQEGRGLYGAAIMAAKELDSERLYPMAALNFLIEEATLNLDKTILESEYFKEFSGSKFLEIQALAKNLKNMFQ